MLVRRELPQDVAAVRAVVAAAFASQAAPDAPADSLPVEVRLVDELRRTSEWLPSLSLVAEDEGRIVGYVVCTRAWVAAHEVLALGPLAVLPETQAGGVGTALVHAALDVADALDEPLVVLLGHTDYYPRFGFVPAAELGITPPVDAWGEHFQARPLAAYDPTIRGAFRYADPFNAI